MGDLELLDLEGTGVQGSGLMDGVGLKRLSQLTLGPRTEDADLELIDSLPTLVELDLRSCRRLTDSCVTTIARHQQLRMVWLPQQVGSANKQSVRRLLPNCQVKW